MSGYTRTTVAQKRKMLEFMRAHPNFAAGRLKCPDGAREKKKLAQELADVLNAFGDGATKTPEKWLKAWQDWRSDVKTKARKKRQHQQGTGGGPAPPCLTSLEEELLEFIGPVAVEGLNVPDPIEIQQLPSTSVEPQPLQTQSCPIPNTVPEDYTWQVTIDNEPLENDAPTTARDRMVNSLRMQAEAVERQAVAAERQAAATETLAETVNKLVTGIENMAGGLYAIATALKKIP